MSAAQLNSRLLALVRPGERCVQTISQVRDLTLLEGLDSLSELLAKAGSVASGLILPQLMGRPHQDFRRLLNAAWLLSGQPRTEGGVQALRGVLSKGDILPKPVFQCRLGDDSVLGVGHDSVSPMLTFEADYQIFRDLQWFLRCWDAVIQSVWASKLFRDMHRCISAPLALGGAMINISSQQEAKTSWVAWDGPAWPLLELEEYEDDEISETWKLSGELAFGGWECHVRAAESLNAWLKQKSLMEIRTMSLTDEEAYCILLFTEPESRGPNLELKLSFSTERQEFVLSFPIKNHDQYGYNKENVVLPESLLKSFLAEADEQLKSDLVRIVLATYRHTIIGLTADMTEPDLY